MKDFLSLPASLLTLVMPVLGIQLPYNPTTLLASNNGSFAYLFSGTTDSSQASLAIVNASQSLDTTTQPRTLYPKLPFLSDSRSRPFIPFVEEDGISVLTGDCGNDADGAELWRLNLDADNTNGTWTQLAVTMNDAALTANYLSAGLAARASGENTSTLYIFGGMCPNSSSTDSNWIAQATYSASMLALSPNDAMKSYEITATGLRAPPIPEAGLTMTSLTASLSDSPSSPQQNLVLIGGHTENAFINMSQVAMFTLPQGSWAFIPVLQPQSNENTELIRRNDIIVEPRSGHTAVLTRDGTKIIVVGGWVGDTNTPAQPQVAVLNIGEEYGGQGDWAWSVPTTSNPYGASGGTYGHGATLLQGDVMLVTGGNSIGNGGGSQAKRQSNENLHFLNTTSMLWSTSYIHPSSPSAPNAQSDHSSTGLNQTEKIGLGAGLGLSFAAVALIVSVWFWYTRRLRQRRYLREKELRELALGAERSIDPAGSGVPDQRYPERPSTSWSQMQEKTMDTLGRSLPWNSNPVNDLRQAERTGVHMDVPSPTRGLRKNLQSRGQFGGYLPGGPPGSVFRIDEEEENSQSGSLRKTRNQQHVTDRTSTYSDPFKDPPGTADLSDEAAEQRKREIQGWVEDWQSAAESILSRNPSQAQTNRTYSTLSQAQAQSHSTGSNLPSGRGSPEKSDRTGSNLSESSAYSQMSFQRSIVGTVSRKESQRSASAGQAMFTGTTAASMGRTRGYPDNAGSGVSRDASRRSVSMREYMTTGRQASVSRNSMGATDPDENRALLGRLNTRAGHADDASTPPTSPVKEAKYSRASSFSRTGAKAMGFLGSVKRVITGTSGVNVHDRVAALENKSGSLSPTKTDREQSPKRPLSPSQEFWRGKQGAKDWSDASKSTGTVRRKPVPGQAGVGDDGNADEWDIESAVQNRVVQVMFTVPKEKLRVVNADALSLLSSNRSDVDHEEEKDREQEVKRMSSVREIDEFDGDEQGKDRDRGLD